jgi:hypothetical protein
VACLVWFRGEDGKMREGGYEKAVACIDEALALTSFCGKLKRAAFSLLTTAAAPTACSVRGERPRINAIYCDGSDMISVIDVYG